MSNQQLGHNDQFLIKAKSLAASEVAKDRQNPVSHDDMYVVWFAKTLGNWKALVSTDITPGIYIEVTYNGAKRETYVDVYKKESNITYEDNPEGIN